MITVLISIQLKICTACTMNSLSTVKKKGGRRPSKHTQQITESSVLPNYNPTDAVKKISEEDWRKNLEITVIISSNSAVFLRSLFLHSGEKNNSESEQSIS